MVKLLGAKLRDLVIVFSYDVAEFTHLFNLILDHISSRHAVKHVFLKKTHCYVTIERPLLRRTIL